MFSTPAIAQDAPPEQAGATETEELVEPKEAECIADGCCKTCKKGKACGDSCIAKSKTCTKPKGCAWGVVA